MPSADTANLRLLRGGVVVLRAVNKVAAAGAEMGMLVGTEPWLNIAKIQRQVR